MSSNFSPCSQNLQRSGSSLLSTSRDYVKLQSEFTLTLLSLYDFLINPFSPYDFTQNAFYSNPLPLYINPFYR